jgi:hypothetical protein
LLLLAGCSHSPAAPEPPETIRAGVTFTRYSPLSRNAELARRMLTPLTDRHAARLLAAKGETLREQAIDLAQEKFGFRIPAVAPPKNGYGLLVFIAPWPESHFPRLWRPPLDRHGLIFVTMANAGNDSKVYERRMPLALLAYENMRATYPIDPQRVYASGLSGGSRVALMLALGYPDVFHGALLNAGSDPIGGDRGVHLPPADLFAQFQHSRLVYLTGEHDELNLRDDLASRDSMREWCVLDVVVKAMPRQAHELADAFALEGALDALDRPRAVDEAELARCNANLQAGLASQIAAGRAALARGDKDAAKALINQIDARYGGLAAPAVVDLDSQL